MQKTALVSAVAVLWLDEWGFFKAVCTGTGLGAVSTGTQLPQSGAGRLGHGQTCDQDTLSVPPPPPSRFPPKFAFLC